jgi:ankyrin repeat protein
MEVVKLLLDLGKADANLTDENGKTPLSWATTGEGVHIETLRELLVQNMVNNGDLFQEGDRWSAPLTKASRAGDEAVMILLLGSGKIDVNLQDSGGLTSLASAVIANQKAAVELLLVIPGIDANIKDDLGRTPLLWAVIKASGEDTMVRLLLANANVDINSKDDRGRTPLSWAAEIAVAGTEAGLSYERRLGVMKVLMESDKVDLNSQDNNGRTPLSWAAARAAALDGGKIKDYQRRSVILELLQTGKVDVNKRDNHGRTPLSWAALEGGKAELVCGILFTAMVQTDMKARDEGKDRLSLLSQAVLAGDDAAIPVLIRLGRLDIDFKDKDGQTPLIRAIITESEVIVRQLLECKADVNLKGKEGMTPLSWAMIIGNTTGNTAIIQLLLDTGKVNLHRKEKSGHTPLTRAMALGDNVVLGLLEESRSDTDTRSNEGRSIAGTSTNDDGRQNPMRKAAGLIWKRGT